MTDWSCLKVFTRIFINTKITFSDIKYLPLHNMPSKSQKVTTTANYLTFNALGRSGVAGILSGLAHASVMCLWSWSVSRALTEVWPLTPSWLAWLTGHLSPSTWAVHTCLHGGLDLLVQQKTKTSGWKLQASTKFCLLLTRHRATPDYSICGFQGAQGHHQAATK